MGPDRTAKGINLKNVERRTLAEFKAAMNCATFWIAKLDPTAFC